MTVQEFFDKYDNKEEFTEKELKFIQQYGFSKDIDDEIHLIQTVYGDNRRWNRQREDYYEINGRYFRFICDEGLTEIQPDVYDYQPVEVRKHEYQKTITVVDWEVI